MGAGDLEENDVKIVVHHSGAARCWKPVSSACKLAGGSVWFAIWLRQDAEKLPFQVSVPLQGINSEHMLVVARCAPACACLGLCLLVSACA